jgi:hypothetical protein
MEGRRQIEAVWFGPASKRLARNPHGNRLYVWFNRLLKRKSFNENLQEQNGRIISKSEEAGSC